MKSIDRLIFEALGDRRSVVLRGVGSLEVKRRKAKQISETEIIPPMNVVLFTPDEIEEAATVSSLVADCEDLSKKEAKALYESWLEEARQPDGSIVIKGAGEISDGRFIMAEPLNATLNPAGEDVIVMEAEPQRNRLWVWWLTGCIIALLLLAGLLGWQKGWFECLKQKTPVEVVATPAAEPVVDSLADEPLPSGITSDDASGAAAATGLEAAARPSGEPRWHVIAGSFSIESNADGYIARLKRAYPELTLEKVFNPRNGHYLASIFSAPTETRAYNKMNQYWDIDLNLWVYEEK